MSVYTNLWTVTGECRLGYNRFVIRRAYYTTGQCCIPRVSVFIQACGPYKTKQYNDDVFRHSIVKIAVTIMRTHVYLA